MINRTWLNPMLIGVTSALLALTACGGAPEPIPTPALVLDTPTAAAEESTTPVADNTATPATGGAAEQEAAAGAATPGSEGAQTNDTQAANPAQDNNQQGGDQQINQEQLVSTGEQVYAANCASCHQPDGEGRPGLYPALNGSPIVTSGGPAAEIQLVLNGQGQMPAFGDALSTEQIAAVISYVHTAWDNNAPIISPQQVQQGGEVAATGSMTDTGTMTGTDAVTGAGAVAAEQVTSATAAPTAATDANAGQTDTVIPITIQVMVVVVTPTPATGTGETAASAAPVAAAGSEAGAGAAAQATPSPTSVTVAATQPVTTTAEDEASAATGTPNPEQTAAADPPEADTMTGIDETDAASPRSPEALITSGEGLYTAYCTACHQPEGQGVEGVYPALADDPFVTTDDPTPVIGIVLTGRAGMPRFGSDLSVPEIAAVASYIRNAWGNEAPVVNADEVRAVRESVPVEGMSTATTPMTTTATVTGTPTLTATNAMTDTGTMTGTDAMTTTSGMIDIAQATALRNISGATGRDHIITDDQRGRTLPRVAH